MGAPGFWLRWSWRDLRLRWVQVVAIALVIALGSGTYAGLQSTSTWRTRSYDDSYAALRAHDLALTLPEGTTVDAGALRRALDEVAAAGGVEAVTVRLVVPVQVDASHDGETILVPGRVVGVEVGPDGGPPVDAVFVDGGSRGVPTDGSVVLDQHFADARSLPPTGTLQLGGGRSVAYVATGLSPQYFLVSGQTGSLFGAAGFAVMWTDLAAAEALAGAPGQVNEASLRLDPGVSPDEVRPTLEQALATHVPDAAATVTALTEEREYRILYDDIEGDRKLYNIFALLILAGAAFAAFNLTGRIVEAQRREIGIGLSLGVPRGVLAVRPLLVAAQIALLGVVLGVGVGVVVGNQLGGLIQEFFPLPVWEQPFQPGTFAQGAALGFVLTFVAAVLPVRRALRVSPVDAIRTGPRPGRTGGLVVWVGRLRLPGGSVTQMPLRDVVRTPRRTVLTALGIAAAIATLLGVVGMLDSFVGTIDRGEREVLSRGRDRLVVDLRTFTTEDAEAVDGIAATPGVARAEPYLRVGGQVGDGDERFDVLIEAFPFDSEIWAPTLVEGEASTDRPGLVLSRKAADDLGVAPGGQVTLRYPVRDGLGYRWEEGPVPVTGIHANPYRFVAYVDRSQASLFDLAGVINVVQVAPDAGAAPTDVQRALFDRADVAAVEPVTAVIDTIRDLLARFTDVLALIQAAVLALAVLIAFNSSSIGSDERRREHATMFAFGLPVRTVLLVSMAESALIGVLATGIGILAGLGLLGWMTGVLLPTTLPDLDVEVAVSSSTYLTAALLGIVAVSFAPVLTVRKLLRMDIPSTLRVVE